MYISFTVLIRKLAVISGEFKQRGGAMQFMLNSILLYMGGPCGAAFKECLEAHLARKTQDCGSKLS